MLYEVITDDSNGNGRSNDEIRAILEATADDLGSAGWDRSFVV